MRDRHHNVSFSRSSDPISTKVPFLCVRKSFHEYEFPVVSNLDEVTPSVIAHRTEYVLQNPIDFIDLVRSPIITSENHDWVQTLLHWVSHCRTQLY